jgi:hypothetical protein
LLPLSFVLVLVVVLVLEKLSNPYSIADCGSDREKTGGRRSRRNEADAANPVPLIPLRFEDDHDDEDEDELVAAMPRWDQCGISFG